MAFCKKHDHLYFDTLRRTKKAEAVLCLIHASYQAEIKKGDKDDIVRMLKNAYELFQFDAGTYTGDSMSQFQSQYTIGHELGIWIDSDLKLCTLAKKVARNEITIKDYFDIFFLNYIQPIDGRIDHPLLSVLEYAKQFSKESITKKDLKEIYNWTSNKDKNQINGLFNMFIGSSYFREVDKDTLAINYPIEHILNCCNKECLDKSLDELNNGFQDLYDYVSYLTKDHRSIELIQDKFKIDNNDMNNVASIHDTLFGSLQTEDENKLNEVIKGYNKIYYGIPGCGKSYYIEHSVLDGVDKENVFRTTFYLDYSNSDFIGQIYPVVKDGNVTYEPIPGPFTKALERALVNKNHMVYLVIEEINRGNAAAIFGDIFQLLDRLKTDENGRLAGSSEYPISNSFIEGYFEQHGVDFNKGQIVIPNNLTILATMNTSDQNVFPLDTAFKRRWDRERVVTDWEKDIDIKGWHVPCTDITWENFASTINEAILETDSNSDVSISEDKQMGAYFAHKNMLTEGEDNDGNALISFTNNVIDYLYNDVTKFNHSLLFEKGINSFNDLYNRVTEYTKSSSDSAEPDVGPHAVLYKLFNEDIVKKLEDNAKKDKGVVKTNIEANGNKDEGTEN